MSNKAEHDFEESCASSMNDLWSEMIDSIKDGSPARYPTDLISERADSSVPVYTYKLYELVGYLDEHWEEAKAMDSIDKAIMYGVFIKAESILSERFGELGGEDMLEEIETTWNEWIDQIKEGGSNLTQRLEEIIRGSEKPAEHLKLAESLKELKEVERMKPAIKPK